MKNLWILLIISFISSLPLAAQDDENINFVQLYYQNTTKAELKVMNNEIDSTLYFYQQSSQYLNPFWSDAYNASVAAVMVDDISAAIKFIHIMVLKGIPLSYFENNNFFKNVTESPQWHEYLNTKPKPSYNAELRDFIIKMFIEDQNVRHEHDGDEVAYNTWIALDRLHERQIDSLFTKYGYPSEDLIGIFPEGNDSLPKGWDKLDIIMIHLCKLERSKYKQPFEKYILESKMKNTLMFTHAVNFDIDSNYMFKCLYNGITDILRIDDTYMTCGSELEILINKNRSRLYLYDLQHTIKKASFGLKKSNFKIGTRPANFPDLVDKEEQDKLKNELLMEGYRQICLDIDE